MMTIQQYIKDNILLFDGAMGTYYTECYKQINHTCEEANIIHKEAIIKIHKEYLEAGAKAIKTNTYSLTASYDYKEIIQAAITNARIALTNYDSYLFGSIGYLPTHRLKNQEDEYKKIADVFIENNVTNFIFETLLDDIGIYETCRYIKDRIPESFIIISFGIQPDGYTPKGVLAKDMYQRYRTSSYVDAFGFNCISGPKHLESQVKKLEIIGEVISIIPNASSPTVVANRTSYINNPTYFSTIMNDIINYKVKIIGGCCGTTPKYIKALSNTLLNHKHNEAPLVKEKKIVEKRFKSNLFYQKLITGKKPIAVELDAPLTDNIDHFIENAKILKKHNVDLITIADCPIARARMDSSLVASKLKRDYGIDAMPHMTCRDRNINAAKALLLGLSIENINNVLIVTGDPISSASRDEVKAVYQFNSRALIKHIDTLNKTSLTSPFYIYGALNLNARNFDIQIRLAKEKIDNGVSALFCQPVHSIQAIENLKRAKQELSIPIIVGILPIISYKNALFMNNEVPGIHIDQAIIDQYIHSDRQEATKLAIDISCDFINQVKDYCDGYYIVTLFKRVDIISKVVDYIHSIEKET